MPEAIKITPDLEESLEALDNAHNITKIRAWLEDTTHCDFGEHANLTSVFYDWTRAKHLYKNAKVYCDIAEEVIHYHATQDRGTEYWPVTSEFEGMADDACIEFCNSRGVIPVLRKCLGQAQVIFSNVRSVRAELGYFEDEGNEDYGHVVIRLEVRTDQDTMLDEYDRWVDWFIDNLSATNRTLFTLTVSRI